MKLCYGAALLAAGMSVPAYAACDLRAEIGTGVVAIRYDPFAPGQQILEFRVRFVNADDGCEARFYLRPAAGLALVSGGASLRYRIDGTTGSGLAKGGELGPYTAFVPAKGSADVLIRAIVPQQQIVGRGTYASDLELRAETDTGVPIRLPVSLMRLEAIVPSRIEMSISGAAVRSVGRAGMAPSTINFPNAETGQTERVFVNLWSNGPVSVSVKSTHGGLLRHTEEQGLTPIAYRARFHGQPVRLGSVATFAEEPPMTLSGASYELAVQLGNTTNKFAGRYQDVITVTVDEN